MPSVTARQIDVLSQKPAGAVLTVYIATQAVLCSCTAGDPDTAAASGAARTPRMGYPGRNGSISLLRRYIFVSPKEAISENELQLKIFAERSGDG
ncbi:unnamed protein product [Gongylonema pulchrum]|uniref:Uncharacterized protein n=1 Tax=Gongylonema pulchrum TaxID=637853 RepID=A0A183D789_9BILA|nr:unnamed protein product [Gongylonema pulchrum]